MTEPVGLAKGLTNYGDPDFALYLRRSFARSMGYSTDMLARPVIGIADTYSGYNNCHRHFPELIEAVSAEQAAGTDPADPSMNELADRWRALIEQFTGADDGIRQSLGQMYREQGAQTASRGMVDPALMEYMGRVLAHQG